MKKIIYKLLLLSTVAFIFSGCEDELIVDEVFSGVTRGAILRTISANNSFNIFDETTTFDAELEEDDLEGGDLLSEINLFLSFEDNTDDGVDNSKDEILIDNFAAADLGISDSGLPKVDFSFSLAESLSTIGLSDGEFFGGDIFNFRFEVILTDGRVFSADNANSTVTSGTFFQSPFNYAVTIKCIPPSPVAGDYILDLVDSFGDGWDGAFLTVTIDGVATDFTIDDGEEASFTVNVPMGTTDLLFEYTAGSFESEHSYEITAPTGETAAEDGPSPTVGEILLNICNG